MRNILSHAVGSLGRATFWQHEKYLCTDDLFSNWVFQLCMLLYIAIRCYICTCVHEPSSASASARMCHILGWPDRIFCYCWHCCSFRPLSNQVAFFPSHWNFSFGLAVFWERKVCNHTACVSSYAVAIQFRLNVNLTYIHFPRFTDAQKKWVRHFLVLVVHSFYFLFFSVSMLSTNKCNAIKPIRWVGRSMNYGFTFTEHFCFGRFVTKTSQADLPYDPLVQWKIKSPNLIHRLIT